ncbi:MULTISPECIES: inorganic phosphate transporter [Flavobacterium]|uniref:Phosphate transporter n=2 Tax=Flavobacterium covae TaxID=2906076 RepID=A0ABW8PGG2_9FLAO|nr:MULTISPECIES: inorganic phosphate transporter [Flavobacterium]AMA49304.1 phosphate transporter [Flavobacterium covae]MCJ1806806.1 inorganic phosphate transporter [Flavobacterium covae]MCJ1809269.1 inorganic phosphate transporter [Flavobacterium covae]OWP81312.1 phosphate transporter [Flavobacterium covae]POR21253.1 phosphate transporter [Flavobacterium columnare]
MEFALLIIIIVVAMGFDLVNGFHDAANSIATVVSTKVLSPTQAVIWAAIFNFAAYWVFDMSVGNTVAKTVDNSVIDLWVILSGLLAATVWNLLTWWLGIPSSSSHTLIGGFAGAAVAHAGFDVLKLEEITKPLMFIVLAPIIGGVISFVITLMTIQRNFFIKLFCYILLTVFTVYMTWAYKDIFDIKPIMIWIIGVLLSSFVLIFIIFEIVVGKNNTAMKEGNLYKKLQLLSSAAFSLGHGGADSQKVMGIICAACIVYANGVRRGEVKGEVPSLLQVTEVLQVKYTNDEGKIKKFKPAIGIFDKDTIYVDGKKIIDLSAKQNIYEDEKLVAGINPNNPFILHLKKENIDLSNFEKAAKELKTLHVYTDKKDVHDTDTKEVIFKDKQLNSSYRYAKIFAKYVDEKGKLKEEIKAKIETKVTNKTMPIWIAFGCYLMIGLGTLMGGWKIVKTMGTKITKVTPLEGVCSETAGALTLFTVSQMGVPVSTTHTITGSIIGVGATKRLSAVRWGVTINLIWAWILTIPVSALVAAIIYYILSVFN